jgi:virulence factor Mce-like protein
VRRFRRSSAAAAALALLLTGCSSVLPKGVQVALAPKYKVTVYFTKAVAFYPQSQVQVMGVRVGTVDSVTPQRDGRVKVVASIERKVPLPAGATASIVPLSLIGERTLTFSPAWRPGQPKLADGAVINTDRTQIPVEVDQALKAFTTLLQAVNPADANTLLHKGAQSFQGNGPAFNAALQQSADLTANIAGQDSQLLAVARNLHRVASVVDGRQKQLGQLISDFSQVSTALASERQQLTTFLTSLGDLIRRGDVIISGFQDQLVTDLGSIAQISLVVKNNSKQLSDFLTALTPLGYMLENGTNHTDHALTLRLALDNVWRSYLAAALRQPNVNPKVPCWPKPYSNCS